MKVQLLYNSFVLTSGKQEVFFAKEAFWFSLKREMSSPIFCMYNTSIEQYKNLYHIGFNMGFYFMCALV